MTRREEKEDHRMKRGMRGKLSQSNKEDGNGINQLVRERLQEEGKVRTNQEKQTHWMNDVRQDKKGGEKTKIKKLTKRGEAGNKNEQETTLKDIKTTTDIRLAARASAHCELRTFSFNFNFAVTGYDINQSFSSCFADPFCLISTFVTVSGWGANREETEAGRSQVRSFLSEHGHHVVLLVQYLLLLCPRILFKRARQRPPSFPFHWLLERQSAK